jgi:hypothetical protein
MGGVDAHNETCIVTVGSLTETFLDCMDVI